MQKPPPLSPVPFVAAATAGAAFFSLVCLSTTMWLMVMVKIRQNLTKN